MEDTRRLVENEEELKVREKMEDTPFGHSCEESTNKIKSMDVDKQEGTIECHWCGKVWNLDADLYEFATADEDDELTAELLE